MHDNRPINLDLTTLKFPVMAITSILHRISGILLFLLFPLMIYFFEMSLRNAGTFAELHSWLETCLLCKLVVWGFGVAILYHLLAGLRHVVMDLGYGETVQAGQKTSALILALTIGLSLVLGIWLW